MEIQDGGWFVHIENNLVPTIINENRIWRNKESEVTPESQVQNIKNCEKKYNTGQ